MIFQKIGTTMIDLIRRYKQKLGLHDSTFIPLEHDDAMVAIVYKVTQKIGKPMILKISHRPKDFFRERYFLQYFSDRLPVPRILNVVEPSHEIYGAILMECLPGDRLNLVDLTYQQAYQLGSILAHIHNNPVARYGDLIDPDTLTADPRVYFAAKFHEGIAECTGNLPDDLLKRCNQYFQANIDLLLDVDGPCIIHRDFRPANIMVHDGELQGIIDWASSRAGFAEDDFCAFEHGEWPVSFDIRNAFFAGYASVRPVPHYNEVMTLLRLSRAIGILGFLYKHKIWQTTGSRIYQYNCYFLEKNF